MRVDIGPFYGLVGVDCDNCAVLRVFHIWGRGQLPIAVLGMNVCCDNCDIADAVSVGMARQILVCWLTAGFRDLVEDLTGQTRPPDWTGTESTPDVYSDLAAGDGGN